MHFLADGEVCVIRNGAKNTPLSHFFLSILYLYDSIFPEKVLIDKLHNFEEGICFPNNDCHGKRIIFFYSSHHTNGCYKQKMFHQKLESHRFRLPLENWVDWISAS